MQRGTVAAEIADFEAGAEQFAELFWEVVFLSILNPGAKCDAVPNTGDADQSPLPPPGIVIFDVNNRRLRRGATRQKQEGGIGEKLAAIDTRLHRVARLNLRFRWSASGHSIEIPICGTSVIRVGRRYTMNHLSLLARLWIRRLLPVGIGGFLSMSALRGGDDSVIHMLVPGFRVEELPVTLPNQNNLRFAPDGTLTTLGYDGRVWRLEDSDGDGLEDTAVPYWDQPTLSVPVGMEWGRDGLYVSSKGKVSRLVARHAKGRAEKEEIIASGWPATDVGSGGWTRRQ